MLDQQELEVSTDSSEAIEAIDRFGEAFLGYRKDAVAILDGIEADPDSVLARVLGAALFLFGEAQLGRAEARAHLDAARTLTTRANDRELAMLEAVEAWFVSDYQTVMARHEDIAARWPRDLVSAKLGQYHAFNRGDSKRMAELSLRALEANPDRAYAHGMAAFGFEQTGDLDRAETEGRLGTEMSEHEPWANHAVAHCLDAGGRLDEGVEWMHGLSNRWADCNSFMYTHNWWHTALFHLDRGETDVSLSIYDKHLWPIEPTFAQDQIGAVSMLTRLEMRGVDVGNRWESVAEYLTVRVDDQVEPFLDVQYLYGLARAGRDTAADQLMANISAFASSDQEFQRADWAEVVEPMARAVLAHARGRWTEAADGLDGVKSEIYRIGGSHAQRDLFSLLLLDSLVKGTDDEAASQMLQNRIRSRTSIPWHHQLLAQVYGRQGDDEQAVTASQEGERRLMALTAWSGE